MIRVWLLAVGLVLVAVPLRAQDDSLDSPQSTIDAAVARIEADYRRSLKDAAGAGGGVIDISVGSSGFSGPPAESAARKKARRAMDALIVDQRGRGDLSRAYRFLFGTVPDQDLDQLRSRVHNHLVADPDQGAAWDVLNAVTIADPQHHFSPPGAEALRLFYALNLAADASITGEARRVVELRIAQLGAERGYRDPSFPVMRRLESDPASSSRLVQMAAWIRGNLERSAPQAQGPRVLPMTLLARASSMMAPPQGFTARKALAALGKILGTDVDDFLQVWLGQRKASELAAEDPGRRFVLAWAAGQAGDDEVWASFANSLRRAKVDERLALADAIFASGLADESIAILLEELAAKQKDWRLVSTALRALALQETDIRAKRILRWRGSKVWQVRLALAESLGALADIDCVDALIRLLGDKQLRVRSAAADSLSRLTGKNHGISQKRWKAWRKEEGKGYQLPTRSVAAQMRGQQANRQEYGPLYYDLSIPSNRIAFVLDKSESMYWGLWDGAVDQVGQYLKAAGPTTSFGVVEFDAKARLWKKTAAPANGSTTKKAVSFLSRDKPYGPTNIIYALRLGMSIGGVDSVVFLSDGLPNRGDPQEPNAILEAITKENRYLRLSIHTVFLKHGRRFAHDAPKDAEKQPLTAVEKARREGERRSAKYEPLGAFLAELARRNEGSFGVAFGDWRSPPPGTNFSPSTDK